MDKNTIIQWAGTYFIFINDLITNIDALFNEQTSEHTRRRRVAVERMINMRRQQILLIMEAHSNEINYEKRLWELDRTKSFWEYDCQMLNEEGFKNNFRMSRQNFGLLCNQLGSFQKAETHFRKTISLEKRVAIALYALGSSAEYRSIANLFGVGKSTVCVILLDFCKITWSILSPQYINNFPLTREKIQECVNGFELLGFPQCLGAIDGCHIEVHPHAADAVDYFNYKGWYSTILFALVDHRYRFLYISIGSPGRCNDSQIFETSLLKKNLNECTLLEEMSKKIAGVDVPVLIIGDSAFRLSRHVMKPYPFNADNDSIKKQFNYALSKSRRVVENSFGHLKARFRRIGKGIDNNIENVNDVVKVCCVLHNFLNENNDIINYQWLQEGQNSKHNNQQPHHETQIIGSGNGEEIRQAIATYISTRGREDVNSDEDEGEVCDEPIELEVWDMSSS